MPDLRLELEESSYGKAVNSQKEMNVIERQNSLLTGYDFLKRLSLESSRIQ
jgi:hypothetical protein